MKFKEAVVKFLKDEDGLTMVEYAVAGALVAAGAGVAFATLGTNISDAITNLGSWVSIDAKP